MTNFVSSYKDLPIYAYQFQTKFRNELRAKSGIMRGREFLMKDLYDFSRSKEEHEKFYEKMKEVYMTIFKRLGIGDQTYLTMSSGGSFSKYSFEFQTITDAGEDTILYDEKTGVAVNKDDDSEDIFADFGIDRSSLDLKEARSVEVGDIYSLGEKYSKALGLTYKNEDGKEQYVYMGSYGLGLGRLMGTIVEALSDEKGIVWPGSVAPFTYHLLCLSKESRIKNQADKIYDQLRGKNIEVLYDDRDVSVGVKFADADLIGIPKQMIVSEKTLEKGTEAIEIKNRKDGTTTQGNVGDIEL
jgi:prolyl-tRNA synthetase